MTTALTPSEDAILHLMRRGYSTREIAKHLDCSTRTVTRHAQRLYAKLGVSGHGEAARHAGVAPATGRGSADVDWRQRAGCRAEDPELFFPIGNTGPALLQIEEAKAVCRRCPVMEPCLQWALETGQDAGVWGGLGEDERRAMKRRHSRSRSRAVS